MGIDSYPYKFYTFFSIKLVSLQPSIDSLNYSSQCSNFIGIIPNDFPKYMKFVLHHIFLQNHVLTSAIHYLFLFHN